MEDITQGQEQIELTEEQLKDEKQKIVDGVNNPNKNVDDETKLPSDGAKKFANIYETVEDLRKGITNLKADVPEYMLNGMSDEALEQYYVDLRKEFSSKPKVEDVPDNKPVIKDDEAKNIVGDDKLWAELDTEFTTNGGLSDEYYDKLNKMGIPSKVVDKYLDGLKSEASLFTNNVYSLAGGEENYNDIKAWAEDTYSQKELDIIASGTHEEILFKMKGVKAEYESKVKQGDSGRLYGNKGSNGSGYKDQQEYLLDVMSPEYRKNPKYKAKVEAKRVASFFA